MNNSMEDSMAINTHFGVVDYVILVVTLLISLVVGIISGWRKSTTTRDFLTGGKNMHPIAVSLSLLGGVISAIAVQGNSTEMYLHGTQAALIIVGSIWGTLIVMFLILPVLYPLNLVSMCQYLEMRFHSSLLKKLGSLVQLLNSVMYLGVCLYAPSLTLNSAIGIPTYLSFIIFGVICAVYITLGGVRAVVYTDVVQTIMMFVGVLAVVIQVVLELGGVSNVWRIAGEGGRLEFFNLDPNPLVRHTFWSVQVLGMYFVVSNIGISQPQFQRLVAVKTLKISQLLCISFFIGLGILLSLFNFSGLVAYATYADCDPISNGQVEKADQILAFMVGDKLSHITGMLGLFVATIAGAMLSSLSSVANAMVVLLWEDFLCGWWVFARVSQDVSTKITKILSTFMIALAVCSAFLVSKLGTLLQIVFTISGAIIGPFDGLFVMAITAPWVNAKGAISGFVVALVFNSWLVLSRFYYGAGQSEPLPMSTEGCAKKHEVIGTVYNGTHFEEPFTSLFPFQNETDLEQRHLYPAFYDISYCYLGSMGIIIVFVVSSIVSFFTGVVKPSEVDLRLVNLRCFRIYCWLYGHHESDKPEMLSFKTIIPQDLDSRPNDARGGGEKLNKSYE